MSCADGCALNALEVKLQLINEKLKFSAKARSNPEFVIDYFPPFGDGEGYTSLEVFLSSFCSCISSTVLTLLRAKMKKTISALNVVAKGSVREEHPKALTHIAVEMDITSPDVEKSDVQAALTIAEEKLCPVWAMIKGNVEVTVHYRIST